MQEGKETSHISSTTSSHNAQQITTLVSVPSSHIIILILVYFCFISLSTCILVWDSCPALSIWSWDSQFTITKLHHIISSEDMPSVSTKVICYPSKATRRGCDLEKTAKEAHGYVKFYCCGCGGIKCHFSCKGEAIGEKIFVWRALKMVGSCIFLSYSCQYELWCNIGHITRSPELKV